MGGQQLSDIRGMSTRLMRGNESGADADCRSAGIHGGNDVVGSGDSTSRDDRDGNACADRSQEYVERLRPTDVSAGLHALGDDEVAASVLGRERLVDRADLPR